MGGEPRGHRTRNCGGTGPGRGLARLARSALSSHILRRPPRSQWGAQAPRLPARRQDPSHALPQSVLPVSSAVQSIRSAILEVYRQRKQTHRSRLRPPAFKSQPRGGERSEGAGIRETSAPLGHPGSGRHDSREQDPGWRPQARRGPGTAFLVRRWGLISQHFCQAC